MSQYESAVAVAQEFTLEPLSDNAMEALVDLYATIAQRVIPDIDRAMAEEAQVVANEQFAESAVLEAAVAFHAATVFARGIAVGRGADQISAEDVRAAAQMLCAEPFPPGCFARTVGGFLRGVRHVEEFMQGELVGG